ncbi:rhamnogalacturonan acetylesterase [Alteromonas pelagimontana]|uniref:Rhamnogalacturonan acetylesterase n=1 Tax=Alteromonas pelagimontana TaxID=1858656 RepID=A0A6M4MDA7_9ALTE|nr:rhamnogalacturonan acetylesterase [Alteromonas pelagimontana]QJR81113.1 rhamnogalacturonan acetylesterase [Alteromonas pelagimontana]
MIKINQWRCVAVLALLFAPLVVAQEDAATILIAGDSTVQDVNPEKSAEVGWGQVLPELLADTNNAVTIDNHAKGGRSTRTFIAEKRWQALQEQVQPGDWVLIQFGHNDQAYDYPNRYTSPREYKSNLLTFVKEVKAKQGNAILITPVMRRYFDKNGHIRDAHGMYPELVKEVAKETATPLIDLAASSWQLYLQYGPEKSKMLFNYLKPGQHPKHPDGVEDDTHFSRAGALEIAKLVVAEAQAKSIQPFGSYFQEVEIEGIDFTKGRGF